MNEFINLSELSKDELIEKLNEVVAKNLHKRASLKESITISKLTNNDTVFFTAAGIILGKPETDDSNYPSAYITLNDVVIIGQFRATNTLNLKDPGFKLAVDQIIGFYPVDRKSFLSQL